MTYLTAWIPFVYLDKLLTLPCKFVFQHTCEHAPAIVGYGFTKAELATLLSLRHGLYANVLYANRIIAVCKITSFLMQEVAALISNFLMEYSYAKPLLFTIVASFLPFVAKYFPTNNGANRKNNQYRFFKPSRRRQSRLRSSHLLLHKATPFSNSYRNSS